MKNYKYRDLRTDVKAALASAAVHISLKYGGKKDEDGDNSAMGCLSTSSIEMATVLAVDQLRACDHHHSNSDITEQVMNLVVNIAAGVLEEKLGVEINTVLGANGATAKADKLDAEFDAIMKAINPEAKH